MNGYQLIYRGKMSDFITLTRQWLKHSPTVTVKDFASEHAYDFAFFQPQKRQTVKKTARVVIKKIAALLGKQKSYSVISPGQIDYLFVGGSCGKVYKLIKKAPEGALLKKLN